MVVAAMATEAMEEAAAVVVEEEEEEGEEEDSHVDFRIAEHGTRNLHGSRGYNRPALLQWTGEVQKAHAVFRHVVLRASVILPRSQYYQQHHDQHQHHHHHYQHHERCPRQGLRQPQRCLLPRLPRGVLERLGSFLGVATGRQLRNVREFADVLTELLRRERQEHGAPHHGVD